MSGATSYSNELMGRLSEKIGIERRYPYFDRKVVEFAFALPEEQRWQKNTPKILIRRAMTEYLPKKVYNRLTKADFSHVFAETFLALGGKSLFNSLAIASIGWVHEEKVIKMYNDFEALYFNKDPDFTQYMWYLWGVFGIEFWYNETFLGKNLLHL